MVEDVVQDFVNLRRRGVNMIGLCPFHNEKTPSFTISPSKNIYKCFGCGKGGNPVQFMMDHEQLSFPESIRYLAKKYGIELEETQQSEEYKEEMQLMESFYLINGFTRDYFQKQLWETDLGKGVGLSYFKSRGFLETTIKKFELGWTPPENGDLYKALKASSYNLEHITKLGLSKSENTDFFRARVMFPIHNLSGKVIGFGGRTLSQNKKTPKYLNSPESEVYNKRKTLYGLYYAKKAIRQQDECILVEGYTDTLALHQGGIENVVASSGTALTVDQIKLIKRYTDNIKVIYDGDEAGVKAAMRGMNLILEQNMNVKLVLLPDGHDPDSYLGELGVNDFKTYLETAAKDLVLFKVDMLNKNAQNDPIAKTGLIKDILESIAKIPDTLKRAAYIKQCSTLLEMSEEILFKETNKIISGDIRRKKIESDREAFRNNRNNNAGGNASGSSDDGYMPTQSDSPTQIKPKESKSDLFYQEKDIARVSLEHGDKEHSEGVKIIEFIFHSIEGYLDQFENVIYASVIREAHSLHQNNKAIELSHFTNSTDLDLSSAAIELVATPYSFANWDERGSGLMTQKDPEKNHVKDSTKSLYRYILKQLKKEESKYRKKITELEKADASSEEIAQVIKVYQKLQEDKRKLSEEIETNLLYKI